MSLALLAVLTVLLACGRPASESRGDGDYYDIVVYGGTSGGVIAAVQAASEGKSVVLIEPGSHLGGLTTGGLGATDIGNKGAIGGRSRDFYRRIADHYRKDESWVYEQKEDYRSNRGNDVDAEFMWTFEPHVAEDIINELLREADVPVVFGERLDLSGGVSKDGARIVSIRTGSGRVFSGGMFIDATYEGDLLALAGVSYTVGRESNAAYGETLNGVQTANAVYHTFDLPVSPYVIADDPNSGLLPGIDPAGPGEEGSGDRRVQAYNFRMCLSDVPENQVKFEKPAGYDSLVYEPLFRYFEAGYDGVPWSPTMMPNRKTDTNNRQGFSTDYIGYNYTYPEADYATRERLISEHEQYQKGLMWTLAYHPRVPEKVRNEVSRWGLAADEFTDNGNWPHQIYVREARRMVSDYVMTQHNCQGREVAGDPVSLAAYTMDSHNVQRYVTADGWLKNEGDVQVGGFEPYPISYRSIVPSKSECTNLLVPVCLSASHIAFGSIRMEPVFMVLGQSAATAAGLALDNGVAVQDIDYQTLRTKLLADGQHLEWDPARN
ncbi:MAG: FAD-dependent oxidoreductase [Candidatus Glassbacteria bacterium]|nr:FAD-dependent oxidoreductase [Candidatus Glassbacteria bacterium]